MGDNTEHARLGCSNPRWEYCPGSIREEAAYPNIPGEAAMDGTGSHLLLELCLKNGVSTSQYERQTIGQGHDDSPNKMGWHVDADRAKRVQGCLDYINDRVTGLRDKYGTDCRYYVISETRSNPGQFYDRDDWWGTCDITIYVVRKHDDMVLYAEACDYKDGQRWVSEKENSQVRDYLLGVVLQLTDEGKMIGNETILLTTIYQPKTKKPCRPDVVTMDQLLEHGQRRAIAAKNTDDPNAPLVAGKHCTYCRHEQNCEAKSQERISKGQIMETNLIEKVETQLATMPAEELSTILKSREQITAAFAKVEAEVIKRLEAGERVPNFFMGEGRASSKWNEDDDVILKKLAGMKVPKDKRYKTTLITPAQARQLDCLSDKQRENLENLISVIAGKPTLKEGEPVKPTAKEMFAEAAEKPAQIEKPKYNFM